MFRTCQFLGFFLLIAVLAACSPAHVPIQVAPYATTAAQPLQQFDDIPSNRPTPTTRFGPLIPPSTRRCSFPDVTPPDPSALGPLSPGQYVAFFVDQPASKALLVKSITGETLRLLPLPEGATLPEPNAEAGISPDGRYFVYFTGGPTWLQEETYNEHDLALHIVRIADGQVVRSIPLLRSSWVDDIDQSAVAIAATSHPEAKALTLTEVASGLFDALLAGITSLAWSPDGQLLAFPAATEGPSSDVYIYDTEIDQVRRLTSGHEEIVKIGWSPDGQWIMHGSAISWNLASSLTNHAVSRDGTSVVSFPFGRPYDRGWLTSQRYLATEGANGIGSYELAALDVQTGQTVPLWAYDFGAVAFDDTASQMLIANSGDMQDAPPFGLYMLNIATLSSIKIADTSLFDVAYWPKDPYKFAAADYENALFAVTSDGTMTRLTDGNWTIFPSPDLSSLALRGDGQTQGLFLLQDPLASPRLLDDSFIWSVLWSPDSSWILFSSGPFAEQEIISTINVPDGYPQPIQVLPADICFTPHPVWVVLQ